MVCGSSSGPRAARPRKAVMEVLTPAGDLAHYAEHLPTL